MAHNKDSKRPEEQDAVFTTIVGGRPPGSGTKVGAIPRGVEVLVKKASVDPEFRQKLLEKRGEAAQEIDLELTEAEKNMLSSISAEQLEKIIENTKVEPEHQAIFLGTAGKLMLAAVIGVAVVSMMMPSLGHTVVWAGISPDRIEKMRMDDSIESNDVNEPNEVDPDSTENSRADQSEMEE
ncbi:MAG: hypothetical protein H8D56_20570 [Planctomycetes bacterium]|nr:hypothetical protein [Planctomycetota bacterium]MBL7146191.1 hypothetical protein [Phycisphaerae bacterium]